MRKSGFVWGFYSLLSTIILSLLAQPTAVAISGANWCLVGGFQGWDNASTPLFDDGTNGDLSSGDGVYSLDFTVAASGRDEFKIVECGNWGNTYPVENAFVVTSIANQVVKFTFDTNDHSGDPGLDWQPTTNIVHANDDLLPGYTAVGDWQGWDNANPATAMTDQGGGLYRVDMAIPTAGTYAYKVSETGNWSNQFGADSRSINAPTVSFDVNTNGDTVQFWLDTTQSRIAVVAPPPPAGCPANPDDICWNDLGHDSRDTLYRVPAGPVTTNTPITLRFRTASNDVQNVQLRLYNDRTDSQTLTNMTPIYDDGTHQWWQATVPASPDPTLYWYRFIVTDGTATTYYEDNDLYDGGWGETNATSNDRSWQLTVYDPTFQTPDWVKNAVIYQIFIDRFRDGDGSNNTPAGSFFYGNNDTIVRSTGTDWHTPVCDPRDAGGICPNAYSQNFYGGDLQGIIDQLNYLQSLGVTALYLNPIFESPSNHKYDTTDFLTIDDNFGDLALFQTLSAEADARGIRLILDGVFNHSSSDSLYFDRYSNYPAPAGGCEDTASPYRDWYYFQPAAIPGTGPCDGDTDYTSWFGYDSLPKLNADNSDVRDFVWQNGLASVGPYWMQWADGWRLDVAGDVDPGTTNDPTNDYWEGFRTAILSANPEAYIVGEEWGNASAWSLGSEWDATMNYQYSSAMLRFWRDEPFTDNDHNTASSAGTLDPITPSQLDGLLQNWQERYPPEAYYAMMNLFGSHDTNRPYFLLDHNADLNDPSLYQNPAYDWSDSANRFRGALILQMTLPGAPTIYYGDEVGLVGPLAYDGSTWQDDPYNRIPYPWLDETGTPFYTHLQTLPSQEALRDYYRLLTGARNSHAALRTGSFDTLLVDDASNIYAYGRLMSDYSDAAVIIVNRGATVLDAVVTVDVAGYLPAGAQFEDTLNGNAPYTVNASGELIVTVPAMSGSLLVLSAPMASAPSAVTDLAVTDERSGELDLGWSAATGADSYDIYRSRLTGGGYTFVANTTGTTYTDTGLENGVTYYYVVVSRHDTNLLESDLSNEVSGVPQHDLSSAWYNLQWPSSIVHTISTSNRTPDIFGQLFIAGATGGSGPAAGITAQIGYGPDGTPPTDPTWLWEDMSYFQPNGNNDEFVGSLLPDMLGTFDYATRYSSDGGATWLYADLSGPGLNGNPGNLSVVASGDTTAPSAPTNLAITGTTPSSVSLEWDANGEGDLAGYELYRQETVLDGGGFVRIAQLDSATTSYVDTAVVTDTSYDYYVLAYDTSFNRSPASNIETAVAEARVVALTVNVTVPSFTPGTVYIVGNQPEIGDWDPGAIAMTSSGVDTWTIDLNILDGTPLEYKFTRGAWEMVEKEADGNAEIPNRTLVVDYGVTGTQVVNLTVLNWRDPIVTAHMPVNSATLVDINSNITVSWSQAMPTDSDFVVAGPGGPIPGVFSYDGGSQTVTFDPAGSLAPNTTYNVTISGEVDAGGDNQLVDTMFSFTTATPTAIGLESVMVDGFRPGILLPLLLLLAPITYYLWQRNTRKTIRP